MHFGGGSTTRTMTVTTTETVHGVMAVAYRYAVSVWTRVGGSAWPGGNDYVYDLTYDYFWGVDYQPYSYTYNVTRTVAFEDQSVADEPSDAPERTEEDSYEKWILPDAHNYKHVSDPFCRGCRMEEIVDALNRVGVHPNQTSPFIPGSEYIGDVDLPIFIGKDDVSVEAIYEGGRQVGVRNTTLENHELHEGVVERRIIRDGDAFRIETVGAGTGRWGGPNVWFHEAIWEGVDDRVVGELGP